MKLLLDAMCGASRAEALHVAAIEAVIHEQLDDRVVYLERRD